MLRNAFGSREIGLVGPELEGRQEATDAGSPEHGCADFFNTALYIYTSISNIISI